MISQEQIDRAISEQAQKAAQSFQSARAAELELESYTYQPARQYNPDRRAHLLKCYRENDYKAERDAWILALMRKDKP